MATGIGMMNDGFYLVDLVGMVRKMRIVFIVVDIGCILDELVAVVVVVVADDID